MSNQARLYGKPINIDFSKKAATINEEFKLNDLFMIANMAVIQNFSEIGEDREPILIDTIDINDDFKKVIKVGIVPDLNSLMISLLPNKRYNERSRSFFPNEKALTNKIGSEILKIVNILNHKDEYPNESITFCVDSVLYDYESVNNLSDEEIKKLWKEIYNRYKSGLNIPMDIFTRIIDYLQGDCYYIINYVSYERLFSKELKNIERGSKLREFDDAISFEDIEDLEHDENL